MARADDIDYGPNIDTESTNITKKVINIAMKTVSKDARKSKVVRDGIVKPETIEKMYYIQNGYVGNIILWWGIDSKGYTTDITKAGKFTEEEIKIILVRQNEKAWPCKYIDNCEEAHEIVIDSQYLYTKKQYKLTIDFKNK